MPIRVLCLCAQGLYYMNKIKIGIVGATGYAGCELVRLLLNHPMVKIEKISSVSFEGQHIEDVYPAFIKNLNMTLTDADSVVDSCDVVFAALPHGLSEPLAKKCIEQGKILIDLGADFRLSDGDVYEKWYGKKFTDQKIHDEALYCIPELHREKMNKEISVVANPGCYPTSIALGLAPAISSGIISLENIIIDSKSGVTGAGRGLTQGTHYPDTNEAFAAYKAGAHRHTPEIEQTLSRLAGRDVKVTFVPHLLPVNRGIESSIYCKLSGSTSLEDIHAIYTSFYKNEKFVRVQPLGAYANIKNVRVSNYCDISLHMDKHTGTLIISSCIDNMVKGAAGQAIQNMHLRLGLDEHLGISALAPSF